MACASTKAEDEADDEGTTALMCTALVTAASAVVEVEVVEASAASRAALKEK